ncbi:unnamed protein product [Blepharisma stoltei]|uniref:G domain-containing protein n=1 Tax=Blepharisma stoltei TaxID=1481888 RepID=A0AAU9IG11_9CILI|nr:unnamed protein product [Blepharisma stoltei]
MNYPYLPNINPYTSSVYKADIRLGSSRKQPFEEPKNSNIPANNPHTAHYPAPHPDPHPAPHPDPHPAPHLASHPAPHIAPHIAPHTAPHTAPYAAPYIYNLRHMNMNPNSVQHLNHPNEFNYKSPGHIANDTNNMNGGQNTNNINLLRWPSLPPLAPVHVEPKPPYEGIDNKTPYQIPHINNVNENNTLQEVRALHQRIDEMNRGIELLIQNAQNSYYAFDEVRILHEMISEVNRRIESFTLNAKNVCNPQQLFTNVRPNNEETKIKPKKPRPKKLDIPPYQKIVSLVIGQTGSGKSTFINIITNFFRNGTLENKKIAIPTKDFPQTERDFVHAESGKGVDQSQTVKCCRYDFKDLDSCSTFTFIDTPGLSDTRGVDQDDKNIKIIENEILKFTDINAIIIVQNGSEARKTASVNNSLVRIRNALPRKVEDNIILVLTNSHISSNFNVDALPVTPKHTLIMDNNAFNIVEPTQYDLMDLKPSWDKSMRKVKEIAEYLCTMGSFSTKCYKEMIEEKDRALLKFHQAKSKLQNLYGLQEQLEEIKIKKESYLKDAKAYQNYKQTKIIEQIDWKDVDYHNTVCSNDESLCHKQCGLEFTPDNDGNVFTNCACMGESGKCKACNCGPESHYHTKKIPIKIQKNVEEILQNVKKSLINLTHKQINMKLKSRIF